MIRQTISQAQRARRFLNQEALKRTHRRCDLIRVIPETGSTVAVVQNGTDAAPPSRPVVAELSAE
jgi:hypothetical protein